MSSKDHVANLWLPQKNCPEAYIVHLTHFKPTQGEHKSFSRECRARFYKPTLVSASLTETRTELMLVGFELMMSMPVEEASTSTNHRLCRLSSHILFCLEVRNVWRFLYEQAQERERNKKEQEKQEKRE